MQHGILDLEPWLCRSIGPLSSSVQRRCVPCVSQATWSWLSALQTVGGTGAQASALVKRFYAALESGKEFRDDAWVEWEKHHPADLQAAEAQVGATDGAPWSRFLRGGFALRYGWVSCHTVVVAVRG